MTDTTTTPQVDAFRVGNLAQHVSHTASAYREAIAQHLRGQTDYSAYAMVTARADWDALRDAWMILTGCRADQVEAQAEAVTGIAHATPWVSA